MSCPIRAEGNDERYREREFLGQVRPIWWDEDARAPAYEGAHETGRHHVNVDMGFIPTWRDAIASLRVSELADDMRKARGQERCFLVLEEEGELHIRSTSL